jgi:hypothetical protein
MWERKEAARFYTDRPSKRGRPRHDATKFCQSSANLLHLSVVIPVNRGRESVKAAGHCTPAELGGPWSRSRPSQARVTAT